MVSPIHIGILGLFWPHPSNFEIYTHPSNFEIYIIEIKFYPAAWAGTTFWTNQNFFHKSYSVLYYCSTVYCSKNHSSKSRNLPVLHHFFSPLKTTCTRKLEVFWRNVRQAVFFTTVFGPFARRIIWPLEFNFFIDCLRVAWRGHQPACEDVARFSGLARELQAIRPAPSRKMQNATAAHLFHIFFHFFFLRRFSSFSHSKKRRKKRNVWRK